MSVTTGFSQPYIALYSCTNGVISYSSAMKLARGVDVTISPESSSDNNFYADNSVAESASGMFTGGTVTLTVDGLDKEAEKLIYGLPEEVDSWTAYNNTMETPYVGVGYIARRQLEGVVTYRPTVIARVMFNLPEDSAATQEDEIDWQTQELEGTIFRAEDTAQTWKWVGEDQATEEAALALMKEKLGDES